MWSLRFVSLGILNTSNHIIIIIARYTIVLQSNEEHHDVPLNQLESLSGLPLRPEEATPGTSVVWLYKKTPYEATIVDPPDQLYSETDSSDSDQGI